METPAATKIFKVPRHKERWRKVDGTELFRLVRAALRFLDGERIPTYAVAEKNDDAA